MADLTRGRSAASTETEAQDAPPEPSGGSWQRVEGWAPAVVEPGAVAILSRDGHHQSPSDDALDVLLLAAPTEWWDEGLQGWVIPHQIVQVTKRLGQRHGLDDEEAFNRVADVLNKGSLPEDEEECDALLDLAFYEREEAAGAWFSRLAEGHFKREHILRDPPPVLTPPEGFNGTVDEYRQRILRAERHRQRIARRGPGRPLNASPSGWVTRHQRATFQ